MKTQRFFEAVLVLTLLVTLGRVVGGSTPVGASAHDWIWQDGFEDGEALASKYEDVSTNGLSVSNNDAFSGTHSLEQHYEQGQVSAGWLIKVNNDGFPDHVFARWYHKFEDGFEGFPPKMARIRYRPRSGDWRSVFAVHFWIEDGEVVADVLARNSSQANDAGWLPIARSGFLLDDPENAGRWICFEMEVKLNTPGETDGLYRFWADDELIVERTGVDLRGNTNHRINEIMLDCYWNGGSPKAQSRYYDDFVISTSKIGPVGPGTNATVTDLRVAHAIADTGILTATLSWTAPTDAVTYTLRYSDTLITEDNWASAVNVTVPFTATPGSTEWLTAPVAYTGDPSAGSGHSTAYFALKSQNAEGVGSGLSNNAFWPHFDVYLPLIMRACGP